MSEPMSDADRTAARVRLVMILGIVGVFDILLGVAAAILAPVWVPGMDEIWWIVGAALAIGGLVMIFVARSIRKRLGADSRTVVR